MNKKFLIIPIILILASPLQILLIPSGGNGTSGNTVRETIPTGELDNFSVNGARFIENMGQIENKDILYYSVDGDVKVGLTANGPVYLLITDEGGWSIEVSFVDCNPVIPFGREELDAGSLNFMIGNDRSRWCMDVPSYEIITYGNIYDGVDLMFYFDEEGFLKYDIVVRPTGSVSDICMKVEGAQTRILDGQLQYDTGIGKIKEDRPYCYQEVGDEIESSWMMDDEGTISFDIGVYDDEVDLVIDPKLIASTYVGGSSSDLNNAVVTDDGGDVYITGYTTSYNFPTTSGAYDTSHNSQDDVLVTKLNSSLDKLIFSTFIGGYYDDVGEDIALDGDGNCIIVGTTESSDFPTVSGSYDDSKWGYRDAFVLKLSSSGSSLDFSTFLGGSSDEYGYGLDLDGGGNVYVTGRTSSSNYPTTAGAFDTSLNSGWDVFVTKFNSNCSSLSYSTYVGGDNTEIGYSLKVNGDGEVYVTGYTYSFGFPTTTGAYDTTHNNYMDVFVFKLSSTGSTLQKSTFIGNTNDEGAYSLYLMDDEVYITGRCESGYPVTSGAYSTTHNGNYDIFVSKLNKDLSSLLLSTYLGGKGYDLGNDILLDSGGDIYVAGYTYSSDYPVTPDAFDTTFSNNEYFISKISSSGDELQFSSYMGGSSYDYGVEISLLSSNCLILTGYTQSTDFPVRSGGYDIYQNGYYDMTVTKMFVSKYNPVNVKKEAGYMYVNLTWEPPSDSIISNYPVKNYTVYRGSSESTLEPLITLGNVTHYNDTITDFVKRTYHYGVKVDLEELGPSRMSDVIQAMPPIPPVLNILGSSGDRYVSLEWDPLPQDVIDLYDVEKYVIYRGGYRETLGYLDEVQDIRTYTDTDFADSPREYHYAVAYILEGVGEGNPSNIITEKPNTPPSIPEDLIISTVGGNVIIEWNTPEDDGGYPVLGYTLAIKSGDDDKTLIEIPSLNYNYTYSGLIPGNPVTISMAAENQLGTGLWSEPVKVMILGPPSSPEMFRCDSSDKKNCLHWGKPAFDWGINISGYRIYRGETREDLQLYIQLKNSQLNFTDHVENGELYYYGISALNIYGESEISGPLSSSGSTTPHKVVGLSVQSLNQEVILRWKDVGNDGGAPITNYRIYRGFSRSDLKTIATIPEHQYHYRDQDLVNGNSYVYAISASNANGEGVLSSVLIAVPCDKPGVVDSLTVKPKLNGVALYWDEPDDMGQRIDTYNIYRGEGPYSLDLYDEVLHEPLSRPSYTDDNLSYGNVYWYSISAVNDEGESILSSVVPGSSYGAPQPPVIISSESRSDHLWLEWLPPVDTGGTPISKYKVQWKREDQTFWREKETETTEYTILDIEPFKGYMMRVISISKVAESDGSDVINLFAGSIPEVPEGFSVESMDGYLRLSWKIQKEPDGSVDKYNIYMFDDLGRKNLLGSVLSSTDSYTIEGLKNGESYSFGISAGNRIGESEISNIVESVPMAGPARVTTLAPRGYGDNYTIIEWKEPSDNGGSDIIKYNIYRSTTKGTEEYISDVKRLTYFEDRSVENGVTYYYYVTAANEIGEGPVGNRIDATPFGKPSVPTGVEIESSRDETVIKWGEPDDDGGNDILGYLVYRGSDPENLELIRKVGPNTNKYTDKEVEAGDVYYSVSAYNSEGEGVSKRISTNVASRLGLGIMTGSLLFFIPLIIALCIVFIPIAVVKVKESKEKKEMKRKQEPETKPGAQPPISPTGVGSQPLLPYDPNAVLQPTPATSQMLPTGQVASQPQPFATEQPPQQPYYYPQPQGEPQNPQPYTGGQQNRFDYKRPSYYDQQEQNGQQ